MRPDWIMLCALLIAGALLILCFTFFFAFVLLDEEDWPGKGWLWDRDPWDTLCEEGCTLCDAARAEVDECDLAGDGSDEGLVRVPPDALLRQAFATDLRQEA